MTGDRIQKTEDRIRNAEVGIKIRHLTFLNSTFRIPNSEFKSLCHLSLTSALSILLYKKIFMTSEE